MENYGILLVDDEPVYHAVVAALLAHLGTVDAVTDGAMARRSAEQRRYHMILVDIDLHNDEDGYAVARALRAIPTMPVDTPIIAFTELAPAEGEDHFVARGFDGWLQKPFTATELYRLAARWLSWSPQPGPTDRLAALIGAEAAGQMVDRLFASLREAMTAIDDGASPAEIAHRLGGLAGTLGFAALSAGWLALQYGDLAGWPTVRRLTLEAFDAHIAAKA